MSASATPAARRLFDRVLRDVRIVVERVDGVHGRASSAAARRVTRRLQRQLGAVASSIRDDTPTFSSQIEMIGTNFENST